MSHINPFHYNIIQNLPSDMMTNLLLSSQNPFTSSNLQYNPFLFMNSIMPQIPTNPQIKDYQSLIFSQLAMANPGYFNPSMILGNQLFPNQKIPSKSINTISNSNPFVNQFNNNLSLNLNFVNYLQNNNFLKFIYQYNQALCANKSAKLHNQFSNITDQKIIKNNGNKNGILNKSENKKDDLDNFTKNHKNDVNNNKFLLKHKTKRPYKKKKKLDSDDESEVDMSSIYSSKLSEKNSTSSTETIKNLENKKFTRKISKFDDRNILLGDQEEYEKFFKNEKNSTDFTDFERNLIEMIDNPRKKKKKSIDPDNESNFSEKINEISEEIKIYLPQYEQEMSELKKDKQHEFMMNNFPIHYKINNYYLNVKKRKDCRSQEAYAHVAAFGSTCKSDVIVINDLKCVWKTEKCECKAVEDYLFEVEKVWPIEEYKFSQEISLDFLKINDYNIEQSLNLIKVRDKSYKELIKQSISRLQLSEFN